MEGPKYAGDAAPRQRSRGCAPRSIERILPPASSPRAGRRPLNLANDAIPLPRPGIHGRSARIAVSEVPVMTSPRRVLVLSIAAALASLGAGAQALGGERVHKTAALQRVPEARFRSAHIDVIRRTVQDQVIRVRAVGGARGDSLLVCMADAEGTLTQVGTADYKRRTRGVEWKASTARGEPLPFGVPDVAFLSGRAVELRTQAGQVVLSGVVPAARMATGIPRKMKSLRQALVVDETLAGDDAEARIVVFRHDGTVGMKVKFESDASGLALEAWVKQADGTEAKLGDLVEQTAAGDDGDDDDDADEATGDDTTDDDKAATIDDDSDDDEDDDATEIEYELVVDDTTTLPFGFTSLEQLAGLAIEIRNAADGSGLASGFRPA